ncbi:MAG: PilZ domain-containing protein [Pseudomonadota bacterium]
MSGVETRSVSRDSLFLLANITLENSPEIHRVRVRNLSDGGMMAEGQCYVKRGQRLEIELRNIGKVMASVAWVQDNRFGIAFDAEVDSQRARTATADDHTPVAGTLERSWQHRAPSPPDPKSLRKI